MMNILKIHQKDDYVKKMYTWKLYCELCIFGELSSIYKKVKIHELKCEEKYEMMSKLIPLRLTGCCLLAFNLHADVT